MPSQVAVQVFVYFYHFRCTSRIHERTLLYWSCHEHFIVIIVEGGYSYHADRYIIISHSTTVYMENTDTGIPRGSL